MLPAHDVVLLGIGHTNAHVLRMWRMQPIPNARLTCVSNHPTAPYSGMLPGVLAGQYPPEAMEIDLVRLCSAAGARLILGKVIGLDRQRRELLFEDRPPLPYDVLSIGIGSVPSNTDVIADGLRVVPIKPMQTFLQRLKPPLDRYDDEIQGDGPARIAVVGGGVGSVEIAFCLCNGVRSSQCKHRPYVYLVCPHERLTPGSSSGAARLAKELLEARGVEVLLNRRVLGFQDGKLCFDNGPEIPADVIVWGTSATAPPLLTKLGLAVDERGFVLTSSTLQSVTDPTIFAVGDSGTIESERLPKAGVYAVREGPILWENMQRFLRGQTPVVYRPQRNFLKLINTGDGRAILDYYGFSDCSRIAWWLKDRIDRKFMAMYQDYTPMPVGRASGRPVPESQTQMRCTGCGGKIAGSVLARALARLEIPTHESVLVGLTQPDDVAVIQPSAGKQLAVTTDFFAAPLDDPYIVGRLAALHAASDVLAKGAKPVAALAIATLPEGAENQQEQLLYELLAGGLAELRVMGATIVGGHTIEGPQMTIGYTVLAEQSGPLRAKGNLLPGDALVLTKPLGTGVLLAAHMQARLKAAWWQPLLDSMLRSNQPAAEALAEFAVLAATDVTGFGLAGHLLEMLRASRVAAKLWIEAIPLLPGAGELLPDGLQSTLAPANSTVEDEMDVSGCDRQAAGYAALFDPQTCGGLLIGVARARAGELCQKLQATGDAAACIIGEVVVESSPRCRLIVS